MDKCFLYNNCNHKDCNKDFCLRKYKLEYLFANSLLPKNLYERQDLFIDDDNTDLEEFTKLSQIEKNIVKFVEEGKNLYLYSTNCGNGKTSWAVRFIQSYLNKIWASSTLKCRALFIYVPAFLAATKDFDNKNNEYLDFIKANVLNADLVIWDDLASKKNPLSDYEITQLLNVINSRVLYGKSNIYTSNICPENLAEAAGERLASRVANASILIELKGKDKRTLLKGDDIFD